MTARITNELLLRPTIIDKSLCKYYYQVNSSSNFQQGSHVWFECCDMGFPSNNISS